MRGKVFLVLAFALAFAFMVSAEEIQDDLHLNIQVTNAGGDVLVGTYDFQFDIANDQACSNVLYSDSATLTTDSRGIISYYLDSTPMNYGEQYYLCYYRDSVLIDTVQIARSPYSFSAKNVNVSGIVPDSNLNLSGYNFSADYLFGSGRYLTDLNVSALNLSEYYKKSDILGFGYYNLSDFNISNYYLASNPNNYLNETTLNLSSVNYWSKSENNLYYTNGNVGIGTTSPQSLFYIDGASGAPSTANSLMTLRDNQSNIGFQMGATSDYGWIRAADVGNSHLTYGRVIFGNDYFSFGDGEDDAQFYLNTTNGYAGLGTVSPNERLEVAGNVMITGSSPYYDITNDLGDGLVLRTGSGGASFFGFEGQSFSIRNTKGGGPASDILRISEGAAPYSLIVDGSGQVGVGTETPSEALDVVGNITSSGDVCANGICLSGVAANASSSLWQENANNIYYEGGNVGIGTTTPGESLDVQGNVYINANNTGDGGIAVERLINGYNTINWRSNNVGLGLMAGGGMAMKISSGNSFSVGTGTSINQDNAILNVNGDGTVGIGTASASSELDVNGTATVQELNIESSRVFIDTEGDMVFRV